MPRGIRSRLVVQADRAGTKVLIFSFPANENFRDPGLIRVRDLPWF